MMELLVPVHKVCVGLRGMCENAFQDFQNVKKICAVSSTIFRASCVNSAQTRRKVCSTIA